MKNKTGAGKTGMTGAAGIAVALILIIVAVPMFGGIGTAEILNYKVIINEKIYGLCVSESGEYGICAAGCSPNTYKEIKKGICGDGADKNNGGCCFFENTYFQNSPEITCFLGSSVKGKCIEGSKCLKKIVNIETGNTPCPGNENIVCCTEIKETEEAITGKTTVNRIGTPCDEPLSEYKCEDTSLPISSNKCITADEIKGKCASDTRSNVKCCVPFSRSFKTCKECLSGKKEEYFAWLVFESGINSCVNRFDENYGTLLSAAESATGKFVDCPSGESAAAEQEKVINTEISYTLCKPGAGVMSDNVKVAALGVCKHPSGCYGKEQRDSECKSDYICCVDESYEEKKGDNYYIGSPCSDVKGTCSYKCGEGFDTLDNKCPGSSKVKCCVPKEESSKLCQGKTSCTTCLSSESCRWCGKSNKPTDGLCFKKEATCSDEIENFNALYIVTEKTKCSDETAPAPEVEAAPEKWYLCFSTIHRNYYCKEDCQGSKIISGPYDKNANCEPLVTKEESRNELIDKNDLEDVNIGDRLEGVVVARKDMDKDGEFTFYGSNGEKIEVSPRYDGKISVVSDKEPGFFSGENYYGFGTIGRGISNAWDAVADFFTPEGPPKYPATAITDLSKVTIGSMGKGDEIDGKVITKVETDNGNTKITYEGGSTEARSGTMLSALGVESAGKFAPPVLDKPATAEVRKKLEAAFYGGAQALRLAGALAQTVANRDIEIAAQNCRSICKSDYKLGADACGPAPACVRGGCVIDYKNCRYDCNPGVCGPYDGKKVNLQVLNSNGEIVIEDTASTDSDGKILYTFTAPNYDDLFTVKITVPDVGK